MVIENLSRACRRNGAGRALRAVASIAVAAASLVAPAAVYGAVAEPEKVEQNITFSIPTSLRCAVKADGTVIAPSGWSMSNSGSGKVEITGVSVSNAIGKLKLSGKSGSVGYAVGEGSGSYAVSYDAADGCKFSSTSNRPLGIESGKTLSWNWNIGKLNASDHRAALDSAASGMARLCDMSFSYASIGNSLSSEGTTGSMSGTVNSQSSSVLPVGGTATANVGNVPANASLSYQWYTVDSNGSYSAIANANGKTLKVLAAYRGKDIVCRVSDSSGHYSGYVETARKPVRNLAPKVEISGSAVYGGKLTAAASGLPSDATYTYKYKWQRLSGSSWVDIANATDAEYMLGGEDIGKQVRVVVSTASNIYTVDDVSAISATVAKAKASISVSISGTKNNSSRLTASVSGLPTSGANTVSYRWQRSSDGKSNWADSTAGDAKSNSIQMQPNDVSWHYRCIVSATNPYYDIASATSAAYGPIAKSTVSAARATISGNAVYGGTIKANVTNVPTVGTNSISYQWQYSEDGKAWNDTRLDGGTTSSVTLSAVSCVGTQYRCVISVDNSYYIVPGCTTDGVKIGKASATVNATISGTAAVGGKLTCSVSGLPTSGSNSVSYQWQYSNDNRTWTNSTYTDAKTPAHSLGYKDAHNLYWRCAVSVTNPYYSIPAAYTDSMLCGKGAASITASISGNAVIGGKLTCSVGGLPSIGTNSVKYKWQYSSDGNAWTDSTNATASSNSITLPPDAVTLGKYFRCVVSATNDVYNDMSATSAASAAIGKGTATASVTVSGSKVYGATLTANPSQPTGTTGTSYQWQRDTGTNGAWVNISNATGKTYVAGTADVGHSVRVLVNTANTYYNVSQCASAAAAIGKATTTVTATVSGTKAIGSKLTVSVGGLPSVGTNTIAYKWQYSSDNKTWTDSNAADAKSNSITTDTSWLNKYARCVITVSGNAYYNVNGATSAAYGPIGKGSHSAPSVSISGAKTYGETLTANVSGQPTGTTSTTYQWQRADAANGTYANISNATGKTYSVGTADMNKYLRVLVNTANTYYNVSQGVSAGYGPIGKASKTISASVSGTKNNTSKLTVSVSGLPTVGTNTVSYQWQYSNNGSTGWRDSTYSDGQSNAIQMKEADVTYYYRCVVSVSGNAYYNVTGATTAAYGPMAKSSHGAPTVSVSGSKTYGSTLTANVSGQPNGTTATSYQWQRADAANGTYANISNATDMTYSVGTADMNKYLRVLVGTTSTYYTVSQGVSAGYGPIGKASATVTATVSGTKKVGSELTVYVGGLPSVGTNTIAYKWQYSSDNKTWTDSNAADAKSNSITTDTSWLNKYARCVITVSGNAYYNVNGATSAAYGPIGKGSHSAPSVSVSGDKAVGATLTASVSGQPDGTTSTTYQWQRAIIANGVYLNISGATGKTYKTVDADENKYVRVLVDTVNTYYTVSQGVSEGYGAITFEAFAVYSADDNSLDFYKRGIPTVGETFNGKTATAVYTGIEKNSYDYNNVPWKEYRSNIVTSTIVDDIAPVSTANWFNNCSKLTSIDLSKCNTSKTTSMTNMFNNCHKLEKVALGENWKWVGTDGFLPAPDSQYIPEASGKWYAGQTAYNPADIPSNKADTYYAYISTTGEANLDYTDDEQATLKCTYTTNKEITPVYQWYRDGKRIDGATKNTYKLTEADCGKNIECHVSDDNQELKGYLSGNKNIPVLKTVNLDANGGKFSDGSTKHTIKYIQASKQVIKYSHTDNIDDEGNATGTYGSNLSTNDVVTIPGATKLTIDVWHATGSKLHDWLAIYPRGVIPSSINYSKATISNGKLGGSFATEKDSATHDTFEVNDNFAQFYFKSNAISGYYGYYAVVKGDCQVNKIISGSNETSTPNDTNYSFDRWNTSIDGKGDEIDNIFETKDNTTLYAKYKDMRSAFAVYCENDKSLNFYKRMNIPSVGDTFNGRAVTAVYTGIEEDIYDDYKKLTPWNQYTSNIETSTIVDDGIAPVSTAYWFSTCQNLTSVNNLNKLNTSKVTAMTGMFNDCRKLTSVGDLSGWDTSSVTNMREMFRANFRLTSVGDLSGWDTSSVTDMSSMFTTCGDLVSIGSISGWNTSRVKAMTYMFDACSSLTSLDLSRWDTSSVTNMREMFSGDFQLTSLDLSGWDTSSVTDMRFMFSSCRKLVSIGNISGWNTSRVKDMSYMFDGCFSLTSLDISGWNTSGVTDMSYMFFYCSKLSLNCSNWNVSKVTKNNDFNTNAPGVIAPAWPSSDEIVDEDPIAPQSNEIEENQSKENNKQEKTNNVLTEQNNQNDNVDN